MKLDEEAARFSPDGEWIAYQSDDLDDRQVYVEPFPRTGERVRLSTTTGNSPTWRGDSRAVYYVDSNAKAMAVDVRVEGKLLRPSAPRELFALTNLQPGGRSMLPDQKHPRMLLLLSAEERTAQPVNVILHWRAALLK